ncbi:MAG: ADP-ribose pyrophosphatase [Parcubacteria group bacterium GW2011_GWC2_39_11]|nr:MAG: ADP-ribose pyrophosphatase [Parcubacteria group bacterium GW2011_GWC2_39_11]
MRTTPTSVSVAVFIRQGEKLLLVKQAEAKGGGWGPPAGHLEMGESVIQAAQRETLEETGLKINLVDIIGVYTVRELERLKIGFVFRGMVIGGELKPVTQEAVELRWFEKKELQTLIDKGFLYKPEYNRSGIADWLAGESYPLNLLKENS